MLENLPDHVIWLYEKHRAELTQALQHERLDITAEQAIRTMFHADPSKKKGAVDWLLKTYLSEGYLWEDIEQGASSKVFETLKWFGEHRKNLVGKAKNLVDYQDLAQVYMAIKLFIPTAKDNNSVSARARKKIEKQEVMAESRVIYRSDQMIVAIPLTERASKWWGRGTRWCTAADQNNYFDNYNSSGALITFTFPQGLKKAKVSLKEKAQSLVKEFLIKRIYGAGANIQINNIPKDRNINKLQMYVLAPNKHHSGSMIFMDEADKTVDLQLIERNWELLEPYLNWAFTINPRAIKFFPTSKITQEISNKAIAEDHALIVFIPNKFRTQEFYMSMISNADNNSGEPLCSVPYLNRTNKICLAAIKNNGRNINHVPLIKRNSEIVHASVKQYGLNLLDIELEKRTTELYIIAISSAPMILHVLPTNSIDKKMIVNAIKINPDVINYVPAKMLSDDLYICAAMNGCNLRYIPDHLINYQVCLNAVRRNNNDLFSVPDDIIDLAMIQDAITFGNASLNQVPCRFQTLEVCKLALEKSYRNLMHVPINLISSEMCRDAVEKDYKALELVPLEFKTLELCEQALRINLNAISYIPDHLINSNFKTIQKIKSFKWLDDPDITALVKSLENHKSMYKSLTDNMQDDGYSAIKQF